MDHFPYRIFGGLIYRTRPPFNKITSIQRKKFLGKKMTPFRVFIDMKIIITERQHSLVNKLLVEERKKQEERYVPPKLSTVLTDLAYSEEVPKSLKVDKFSMFDEYNEMVEISKWVHNVLKETPESIPGEFVKDVLKKVERLIDFGRMFHQPIHLNIFSDKYGNEFIQARSSVLTDDGRVLANAYVGSPNVYKGRENDEEAMMRGRKALLKKMRKYFIVE